MNGTRHPFQASFRQPAAVSQGIDDTDYARYRDWCAKLNVAAAEYGIWARVNRSVSSFAYAAMPDGLRFRTAAL